MLMWPMWTMLASLVVFTLIGVQSLRLFGQSNKSCRHSAGFPKVKLHPHQIQIVETAPHRDSDVDLGWLGFWDCMRLFSRPVWIEAAFPSAFSWFLRQLAEDEGFSISMLMTKACQFRHEVIAITQPSECLESPSYTQIGCIHCLVQPMVTPQEGFLPWLDLLRGLLILLSGRKHAWHLLRLKTRVVALSRPASGISTLLHIDAKEVIGDWVPVPLISGWHLIWLGFGMLPVACHIELAWKIRQFTRNLIGSELPVDPSSNLASTMMPIVVD